MTFLADILELKINPTSPRCGREQWENEKGGRREFMVAGRVSECNQISVRQNASIL